MSPLGLVTEQNRLRYINDGPHQLMGCKTGSMIGSFQINGLMFAGPLDNFSPGSAVFQQLL